MEALGEELYGSMIDHGVDLTREVADYIKATDGLELLVEPQFASVLFRVVPKDYPAELLDSLNQNVADELFAKGEANIGVTRVSYQKQGMLTRCTIAKNDHVKPHRHAWQCQSLIGASVGTSWWHQRPYYHGDYQPAIDW